MKTVPRSLFLPVLLALIFGGCSKRAEGPKPLAIGMELTFPPFEMTDASGKPDGIEVRMAEALGEHLGRPIQIRDMGFDLIMGALKTGKVDIVLASLSVTEERKKSIDYSDPYVTNGLCALVALNSTLQKPEDFQRPGLRVAVKAETTGEKYCEQAFPQAIRIRLDEASDCILQVVQGKADAFIYDQISIYKGWKEHEKFTRPILQPFRNESWAIGLRKGDDKLRGQINDFLRKFREEKGFERLVDRYMKREKEDFERLGVPFIFH